MDTAGGIIICGAGPAGLGAAWRLTQYEASGATVPNWELIEQMPVVGGMANSVHEDGFVWDLGGHVLFPHYEYFDNLLDELVDEWERVVPVRGAWMWDRFIPYPVQRNVHRFPTDVLDRTIAGLVHNTNDKAPTNFEEYLKAQFGDGLYTDFLEPLNVKMWATLPTSLSFGWADQRSGSGTANVPVVDVDQLLADVEAGIDRPAWDPTTTIRYPAHGGTGKIWEQLVRRLPAERVTLGTRVQSIDSSTRTAHLDDGREKPYQHLISTMPLDRLLDTVSDQPELARLSSEFRPAQVHIVGLGFRGEIIEQLRDICSLYVPELDLPFWRLSILSNYSPTCVPTHEPHWSLLCEVNCSDERPFDVDDVVGAVTDGLRSMGFVTEASEIVSTFHRFIPHGYPVPLLGRDDHLDEIARTLEPLDIYSRGRFGGWRYEVSNQDHAFMQGVEIVDRLLRGAPESTYVDTAGTNSKYAEHRHTLR